MRLQQFGICNFTMRRFCVRFYFHHRSSVPADEKAHSHSFLDARFACLRNINLFFLFVCSFESCVSFPCWHPSNSSMKNQSRAVKVARCTSYRRRMSFRVVSSKRECCILPGYVKATSSCTSYSLDTFPVSTNTDTRVKAPDSWTGEMLRYKILLELCEQTTVVIGRQENSIASSKSSRPSSGLNVYFLSGVVESQSKVLNCCKQVITFNVEMEKSLKIENNVKQKLLYLWLKNVWNNLMWSWKQETRW